MRVPRTRYPIAIELSYARDIKHAVGRLETIALRVLAEDIRPLMDLSLRDSQSSMIDDDVIDWVEQLIAKLKELIIGSLTDGDAKDMVTRYMNAIDTSNRNNVATQIMTRTKSGNGAITASVGVPNSQPMVLAVNPVAGDMQLQDYMKGKIRENVSYIKTIRDDYSQKIEQAVYRGVTGGQSYGEIAKTIKNQTHTSDKQAAFIARDQSGTIYGQMTKVRHQAAGIDKFQWRTMEDERVRPSHAAREGAIYSYDTADLLPGEDFNCRCTADPVFDE